MQGAQGLTKRVYELVRDLKDNQPDNAVDTSYGIPESITWCSYKEGKIIFREVYV